MSSELSPPFTALKIVQWADREDREEAFTVEEVEALHRLALAVLSGDAKRIDVEAKSVGWLFQVKAERLKEVFTGVPTQERKILVESFARAVERAKAREAGKEVASKDKSKKPPKDDAPKKPNGKAVEKPEAKDAPKEK